ncbi:hypothetical protein IT409_02175 [Candidatus Falkowbacteria bacterium]|nr:hypothetical protein [Candidatus Falkowbacteria bacterium]
MLQITYTPHFFRQFQKLSKDFGLEVLEKIELLKEKKNHKLLKVHKLKGILAYRYSFSVSYSYRIIFTYNPKNKNEVLLHAIGDHDVYKE